MSYSTFQLLHSLIITNVLDTPIHLFTSILEAKQQIQEGWPREGVASGRGGEG